MKHFRILLPLLILALVLSGCGQTAQVPYDYTVHALTGDVTFTVHPATCTITHGEDVYTYQVEKSGSRTSYVIDYPNGATFHWTQSETGGAGGWSDDYDEGRYISGNILVDAIEKSQPREVSGNIGIGLLLIGLGAVNFFLPQLSFYLRYGWAVENAEPSDTYIIMTRAGGVLAALVGVIQFFI